ncbi:MAG TPA: N-acetylmuramoyl-L-alanine amidase-like domain-containing protein [Bacteroidota bacterium]|nr:N-acetylmuramoyl-L-alanine amidase-like domain-containing protein [Bacteroidota bacterium]
MSHPDTHWRNPFFRRSLSILLTAVLFFPLFAAAQSADRKIANAVFSNAFTHKMIDKPIGSVMIFVGKQFLGYPYVPNTLDTADSEVLVCDLHSFDCVTFVENVLALSRCIKKDLLSFESYQKELTSIRYRNGVLRGYSSRLHYFSDWIFDNEKKGITENVTHSIGGVPYRKVIKFMSTHRPSYTKLSADSVFQQIVACEESLNTRSMYYIPKSLLPKVQSSIRSGDILAITTAQPGLDVSHTGIAVRGESGTLLFLHAPDVGEFVTLTKEPLENYLNRHPAQTGIMVARPRNPE